MDLDALRGLGVDGRRAVKPARSPCSHAVSPARRGSRRRPPARTRPGSLVASAAPSFRSGGGGAEQYDEEGGGPVEGVAPGVAGPVLDDRVARAELDRRAVVQLEDDPAGQDVLEVDRDRG